jgi:methylphosphotriester-DNA--protein-cysteine methyltransferase
MAVDPPHPDGGRRFTLIGTDGCPYPSAPPGTLGGHRRSKIFGRLDCPAALLAIARGGYVDHRVYFADADTAERAGYRPCARCMPEEYGGWKSSTRVPPPIASGWCAVVENGADDRHP